MIFIHKKNSKNSLDKVLLLKEEWKGHYNKSKMFVYLIVFYFSRYYYSSIYLWPEWYFRVNILNFQQLKLWFDIQNFEF